MKIKRIIPFTLSWEREANRLARSFVAGIYPCSHCGHPVISGYCCDTCGSSNPQGTKEEKKEFSNWVFSQQHKND